MRVSVCASVFVFASLPVLECMCVCVCAPVCAYLCVCTLPAYAWACVRVPAAARAHMLGLSRMPSSMMSYSFRRRNTCEYTRSLQNAVSSME